MTHPPMSDSAADLANLAETLNEADTAAPPDVEVPSLAQLLWSEFIQQYRARVQASAFTGFDGIPADIRAPDQRSKPE